MHSRIRQYYLRHLTRPSVGKKNDAESLKNRLPKNMQALYARLDHTQQNRDINALVRLGKVIHYQKSEDNSSDDHKDIDHNDIEHSRFWGSQCQDEIKRNEALVRVWRLFIAHAAATLTQWLDPENTEKNDILTRTSQERALKESFQLSHYEEKAKLLFGTKGLPSPAPLDEAQAKCLMRKIAMSLTNLRNNIFHFKGKGKFIDQLNRLTNDNDNILHETANELWRKDRAALDQRIETTLFAAHYLDYMRPQDASAVLRSLQKTDGDLPLPRFIKLLRRAQNTARQRNNQNNKLPTAPNRANLEKDEWLLCQYTTLKLLYERPFRAWLESLKSETIGNYINKSVDAATKAAREINRGKNGVDDDLMMARAASLQLRRDSIAAFIDDLTAATATEMRVQRAYEPDAEQARKQSTFIENLKCDVLITAFIDFIKASNFEFLLQEKAVKQPTASQLTPQTNKVTKTVLSQSVLYLLLHLAPVNEVSKLLHQLRKWRLLCAHAEKSSDIDTIALATEAMSLYLDMHDSKFEGGESLSGNPDFSSFFDTPNTFNKVFPNTTKVETTTTNGRATNCIITEERRLPIRGLREIMRFGYLPMLQLAFKDNPVTSEQVNQWHALSATIAEKQQVRTDLHNQWALSSKSLDDKDLQNYATALKEIVIHRRLTAHLTLQTNVRIHHVVMAVLGRLVDYSGLWERDLYFATLALMHLDNTSPEQCFNDRGIKLFKEGRILNALDCLKTNAQDIKERLLCGLQPIYNPNKNNHSEDKRNIRKNFAHFNMLRSKDHLNLTQLINDARKLVAHDRKLKNAVTKSIIELLAREGVVLAWPQLQAGNHQLDKPGLSAKYIRHLGKHSLREYLHDERFLRAVAVLFGGCTANKLPDNDIAQQQESNIRKLTMVSKSYFQKKQMTNRKREG